MGWFKKLKAFISTAVKEVALLAIPVVGAVISTVPLLLSVKGMVAATTGFLATISSLPVAIVICVGGSALSVAVYLRTINSIQNKDSNEIKENQTKILKAHDIAMKEITAQKEKLEKLLTESTLDRSRVETAIQMADKIKKDVDVFKENISSSSASDKKRMDALAKDSEKIDSELTEFKNLAQPILRQYVGAGQGAGQQAAAGGPGANLGVRFRGRRADNL